jgi:hemolysin III
MGGFHGKVTAMTPPKPYTRAEVLSDAVLHVTGLAMVLVAGPILVVLTALARGDAPAMIGVGVYAAAMLAMIGASALYNLDDSLWGGARGWLLQRLDHAAIYLKIAGTYTPFTLITGQGFAVLAMVWGAAGLGVVLKMISPQRFRGLGLFLYLAMGWVGVLAGQSFLAALPGGVVALMLAGGALYTLGVVFYLWRGLPFHYTIWHGFVLAATGVFYAAVVVLVVT